MTVNDNIITDIIDALKTKNDDSFEPYYNELEKYIANSTFFTRNLISNINDVPTLSYFLNYKDVKDIISKQIDNGFITYFAEQDCDTFKFLFELYCNHNKIDVGLIERLIHIVAFNKQNVANLQVILNRDDLIECIRGIKYANGKNLLHNVIKSSNDDVIECIIKSKIINGQWVNASDNYGHSSLHYFRYYHANIKNIELLLKTGLVTRQSIIVSNGDIYSWVFEFNQKIIALLIQYKIITSQDIVNHCYLYPSNVEVRKMIERGIITEPVADENGILYGWFFDSNNCEEKFVIHAIRSNPNVELKTPQGIPILVYLAKNNTCSLRWLFAQTDLVLNKLIESRDNFGLSMINYICSNTLSTGKKDALRAVMFSSQLSDEFLRSISFSDSTLKYDEEFVEYINKCIAYKEMNNGIWDVIKRITAFENNSKPTVSKFQKIIQDNEEIFTLYGMDILWFLVFHEDILLINCLINSGKLSSDVFTHVFANGKNIFHYVCSGNKHHKMIEYFIELETITKTIVNANDANGKTPFEYAFMDRQECNIIAIKNYFIKSEKLSFKSFVDEYGIVDLRKFQNVSMLQFILRINIIPCDVWNKVIVDKYGRTHSVITRNNFCWDIIRYLLEQTDKITSETRNMSEGRVPIEIK